MARSVPLFSLPAGTDCRLPRSTCRADPSFVEPRSCSSPPRIIRHALETMPRVRRSHSAIMPTKEPRVCQGSMTADNYLIPLQAIFRSLHFRLHRCPLLHLYTVNMFFRSKLRVSPALVLLLEPMGLSSDRCVLTLSPDTVALTVPMGGEGFAMRTYVSRGFRWEFLRRCQSHTLPLPRRNIDKAGTTLTARRRSAGYALTCLLLRPG